MSERLLAKMCYTPTIATDSKQAFGDRETDVLPLATRELDR
jgi:hypothetical protein